MSGHEAAGAEFLNQASETLFLACKRMKGTEICADDLQGGGSVDIIELQKLAWKLKAAADRRTMPPPSPRPPRAKRRCFGLDKSTVSRKVEGTKGEDQAAKTFSSLPPQPCPRLLIEQQRLPDAWVAEFGAVTSEELAASESGLRDIVGNQKAKQALYDCILLPKVCARSLSLPRPHR